MADKPKTSGRDYAHRTYMEADDYTEAMKRSTQTRYGFRRQEPHSEDKKPYMDDEYPEMEYYWTPWDPPNMVPPGIPDDPRIPPQDPDNPSAGDDPEEEEGPAFTGCLFKVPRGPLVIGAGQTTFSGIGVTEGDPLVKLYVNYGPASLLTTPGQVNGCIGRLTPNCIVGAQALEDFDKADYHQIGDYLPVQIVGRTASGWECAWDFLVAACPPETEFTWDDENNATTVNAGGSVFLYVLGGAPPFTWNVSGGGGFSLANSVTEGRSNTLYAADTGCGTAVITVLDGCNNQVTGYVRNLDDSEWVESRRFCTCISGAGGCCYGSSCIQGHLYYAMGNYEDCQIGGYGAYCAWSGG